MTNLLDSKATWKSNPMVIGTYCGQAFKGQVIADRMTGGNYMQFKVALESPIMVFGEERNAVLICGTRNTTDTLWAVSE